MTLTFRYKKVNRPNGVKVDSPMIPITLQGKIMTYQVMALLDSGADVSAIPKSLAELLNLDLSGKKEEVRGISGTVTAVTSKMNLSVGKPREKYNITIPVKVILEEEKNEIIPILGRVGFFENFIITFNQQEKKVSLNRKATLRF